MHITIETDEAGATTLTVDGETHEFAGEVGRVQAFHAAAHALADDDADDA